MTIRMYHEDCFDTFERLPDESVDLVLCDPPYGTTACAWDAIIPLGPMWESVNRILKKDGVAVFMAAQPFTTILIGSNLPKFKYCWYWLKNQGTNFFHAKRMPIRKVEEVVVFGNNNKSYTPLMVENQAPTNSAKGRSSGRVYRGTNRRNDPGGKTTRYPDNILQIKCVDNYNREHASQKPELLMEYLVLTYSKPGQLVLDFAMGSGTTGVACKKLGRHFVGCDSDEESFKTAKRRILAAKRS